MNVLFVTLYNFAILAGTAFLVAERDWNPWWFAFTLCCLMSTRKEK